MRRVARARLRDAEVLLEARRYDGAVYLCGYAVELGLKARICRTLRWAGYPESSREFRRLGSFRVHDLDVLPHLTGRESAIKQVALPVWSAVAAWSPDARYRPVGTSNSTDARLMIEAARSILEVL